MRNEFYLGVTTPKNKVNKMSVYMKEVYDVKLEKMGEFAEFIPEMIKAIKGMNKPYVKNWTIYQSKYKMGRYYEVWTFDEQANVDKLFESAFTDPHFKHIPPRFFELIVPGSHDIEFLTKAGST